MWAGSRGFAVCGERCRPFRTRSVLEIRRKFEWGSGVPYKTSEKRRIFLVASFAGLFGGKRVLKYQQKERAHLSEEFHSRLAFTVKECV